MGLAEDILGQWEESGIGATGDREFNVVIKGQGHRPITKVMYATALVPGGACATPISDKFTDDFGSFS